MCKSIKHINEPVIYINAILQFPTFNVLGHSFGSSLFSYIRKHTKNKHTDNQNLLKIHLSI